MNLMTLAAWIMGAAFLMSTAHEVYRTLLKGEVSQYDSTRNLVTRTLPFNAFALVVVAVMGFGVTGADWAGLVLSVAMVGASAFYYNPTIMAARQPEMIDWIEDVAYTGAVFTSSVLLVAHVTGTTLTS